MSNQPLDLVFDALGDPTRRRILELLSSGPTPVGHLAQRLPVGRPAVSKHLKVLRGAGLIEHQSIGTRNLYALAPEGLVVAQMWLVKTWDTALSAFAEAVDAETVAAETGPAKRSSTKHPRPSAKHPKNTTRSGR